MKHTRIFYVLSFAALMSAVVMTGCSGNAEKVVSEEEAIQMMDAGAAGRNAARELVNREWTDTIQLQHALLEAKAKQSEYLKAGDTKKAAEFDSAFVSTVRTVNPALAAEIFNQPEE